MIYVHDLQNPDVIAARRYLDKQGLRFYALIDGRNILVPGETGTIHGQEGKHIGIAGVSRKMISDLAYVCSHLDDDVRIERDGIDMYLFTILRDNYTRIRNIGVVTR